MAFSVTVTKSRRLERIIDALTDRGRITQEVASALTTEAWIILGEALPGTPLEHGPLRASQHVNTPKISNTEVTVEFGFGGPSAPYAFIVHEMPSSNKWTTPGTGPKYLEGPVRAALPRLGGTLSPRVAKNLGIS